MSSTEDTFNPDVRLNLRARSNTVSNQHGNPTCRVHASVKCLTRIIKIIYFNNPGFIENENLYYDENNIENILYLFVLFKDTVDTVQEKHSALIYAYLFLLGKKENHNFRITQDVLDFLIESIKHNKPIEHFAEILNYEESKKKIESQVRDSEHRERYCEKMRSYVKWMYDFYHESIRNFSDEYQPFWCINKNYRDFLHFETSENLTFREYLKRVLNKDYYCMYRCTTKGIIETDEQGNFIRDENGDIKKRLDGHVVVITDYSDENDKFMLKIKNSHGRTRYGQMGIMNESVDYDYIDRTKTCRIIIVNTKKQPFSFVPVQNNIDIIIDDYNFNNRYDISSGGSKRNKTKRKRNKTKRKRNKTKRNKTKRNKTKR